MNEDDKTLLRGHIKNETIHIENVDFGECTLEDCLLIYTGCEMQWKHLKLINCQVRFTGRAAGTVDFIRKFCDKTALQDTLETMIPITNQVQ